MSRSPWLRPQPLASPHPSSSPPPGELPSSSVRLSPPIPPVARESRKKVLKTDIISYFYVYREAKEPMLY